MYGSESESIGFKIGILLINLVIVVGMVFNLMSFIKEPDKIFLLASLFMLLVSYFSVLIYFKVEKDILRAPALINIFYLLVTIFLVIFIVV